MTAPSSLVQPEKDLAARAVPHMSQNPYSMPKHSAGGIDENAAGPMGTMMNEMTRIAEEARVAVVVLHHSTEGRGKARGSTTITASVDVVISIHKDGDDIRVRPPPSGPAP